jgi:peptidoglycan/xylan/chitin deacetylase (PgdA/CDA1 family)
VIGKPLHYLSPATLGAGILRRAARYHRTKPFKMRNASPLVSFTFDDVPDSAFLNGAPVLERHGLKGTFYIAGGTCGATDAYWHLIERDQVRALYTRGHEIGCHTFSHVPVETLGAAELEEECRRNLTLLRELCPGIALANFCYPFGRASLPRKRELQRRFDSCRGIYEGINTGTIDLAMLRVIELYDRTLTPAKLDRVIRETRDRKGWLIFYTHDVADPPSGIGCSPGLLGRTIEAVQAAGLRPLPVRDALSVIGYEAAKTEASDCRRERGATPAQADIQPKDLRRLDEIASP